VFRYVAAIWNVHSETQAGVANLIDARMRADSTDWHVTFRRPGLVVYVAGVRPRSSEAYLLDNHGGVVLGTVFVRIGSHGVTPDKAAFGPAETLAVLQTRGRLLAEEYWGRYVAFLAPADKNAAMVMRSPTGELDCLSTDIRGVKIYFSAAEHCPLLSLRKFSINWDYLAADMATIVPDTRETGLVEVERVLRGECLRIRSDKIERELHWHPFKFVREPIDDPTSAAAELRAVTRGCVDAWASCYRSIVPMLSGGLDSSIVVGLLSRTPTRPQVTCLNYHNPHDLVSDERRYARAVAARAGYELVEYEQSANFSLEFILNMPQAVSPYSNIFGMGDITQLAELARNHGAGAWFLGHGGDEVFFKSAGKYSCADFVHRHGLRPRTLSIALDAARMTHRSLWPTLRAGLRDGLSGSGLDTVLREYEVLFPLLRPDVVASVRSRRLFVPSWFDRDEQIAPGKCFQIICLSVTDAMHRVYAPDDDPEVVNPLKAQPVQELCLRIPTHVLAHGGRSRGLARLAFADDLPAEIARRPTKGAVRDYIKAIWTANRPFVSSLLLDGALVRQGIVDRVKLEKTLAGSLEGDYTDVPRLASLACVEAWVQSWERARERIAA
jgi:asparagine synthase (glutamine-hydrolysing)